MRASAGNDITIRAATVEDAALLHAGIVELSRHLGAETKIRSTPADLAAHGFGERPAFEALIAEGDSSFAGMCLFFQSFSTWIGRPGVYVLDLVVMQAFRGRGIGEMLLRRTAAIARDRGWSYLRLSVDAQNESAAGFYERLGLSWSREERIMIARDAAFETLADAGRSD